MSTRPTTRFPHGAAGTRRRARVLQRPAADSFDRQFWPIVMAMCLLAAMTAGAAVTVLDGIVMWVTLMVLPGFVAVTLAILRWVDHRWLRRSIVFAAILSLAVHLFLLVMAHWTYLFGRPVDNEVAQPETNRSRPIRVTFRVERPVDPPVEQPPTPEPETQPIAKDPQPTQTLTKSNTELATSDATQVQSSQRQQQPSPRVVRQGRSPSELSRQTQENMPQSSMLAASSAPPTAQPTPRQTRPAQPASSTADQASPTQPSDATSLSRSTTTPTQQPAASASPSEPATSLAQSSSARSDAQPATSSADPSQLASRPLDANPAETPPQANPADSRVPEATQPAVPAASLSRVEAQTSEPSPAASIDRKSSESVAESALRNQQLPRQQIRPSKTSVPDQRTSRTEPESQSRPSPAQPSESLVASETRPTANPTPNAPSRSQIVTPNESSRPRETQVQRQTTSNIPNRADPRRNTAPATNIAEQTPAQQPRHDQPQTAPSITPAATQVPRRSPRSSPDVSSPRIVETPAVTPSQNTTGTAQSSPQPTAIAKSTTGQAGGGSSPNLKRETGPEVSPASVASNSSSRQQRTSRDQAPSSLAPQQQSQVAQNVTGAPTPQVTIPIDSPHGSLSGAETPAAQTADSSASIETAAADAERGEMSADRGDASVDVGPTKIVADESSTRRNEGGGGQPQLSQTSTATTQPGQSLAANVSPSVSSDNPSNEPVSPLASGSSPELTEAQPDSRSTIAQRPESRPPATGQRDATEVDQAPTSLAVENASGTERSTSNQPASNSLAATGDSLEEDSKLLQRSEGQPQVVQTTPGAADLQNLPNAEIANRDPSETDNQGSANAPTPIEKQLMGSMQSDRARRDSLVQANNEDDARIANSSTSRRSRLGSDQQSRMIVGQSEIDPAQISPQIGGLTDSPSPNPVAAGGDRSNADSTEHGGQSTQIVRTRSNATGQVGGPEVAATANSPAAQPSSVGQRSQPASDASGQMPAVNSSPESTGEPLIAANLPDGPAGGRPAEQPESGMGNVPAAAGTAGNDQTALARESSPAGMRVDNSADLGPGGLASEPDERLGINSVRASRQSNIVQMQPESRFLAPGPDDVSTLSPQARIARQPFRRRNPNQMQQPPQNAKAIELGLGWLARVQNEDGSWSLENYDEGRPEHAGQLRSDAAATGLALLAFQGAGFNHKDYRYSDRLQRAVDWLVEHQQANGDLFVPADANSNQFCHLYSHGIAALALTEAYGMTQDPRLREPAQKALDFIMDCQDRKFGGWRYYPNEPDRRSDLSVSGWMMMALQSGRLAGLETRPESFERLNKFMGLAQDTENEFLYRYNPTASPTNPKTRGGLQVTHSMTAVGLLVQLYDGWSRDDERTLAGSEHLLTRLPADSTIVLRDTYYWYYATLVLNHVGGTQWERWREKLEPLLVGTQVRQGEAAGSWDPYYPVADRWGAAGGRLYVTTLNLLSLEVEYRKLPIYEDFGTNAK